LAANPWEFGWTQLLTIAGLSMTGVISICGLRTFDRWKREKLEERRIEVALDALSIAYHTKYIFDYIRGAMVFPYEWEEMPERPGEPEDRRAMRGQYFAVLKRMEKTKEFFDSVWKVQPRVMALFGQDVEAIFLKFHEARRQIEVSAGLLWQDASRDFERVLDEDDKKLKAQQRADICGAYGSRAAEGDRVGAQLQSFRNEIESLCRPVVERGYRP
jgi:hypothetical protein